MTSRLAPRERNSCARRSPTSSATSSVAVATAMPSASAAAVNTFRRGFLANESLTIRKNIVWPPLMRDSTPDSFPAPTVNTADLLKFLIDRTNYIKLLEEEDTPEAFSRIENQIGRAS